MYRKILIPLDGSGLSECSLQHAKAIAKGCNAAELIVLRVIEPLSAQTIAVFSEDRGYLLEQLEQDTKKEAKNYIAKLESSLKAEGFPARGAMTYGRAADEIMNYSQENHIDLIVMGTHGRSGVSRFYFGSVAEKVSRHSPVPVLLISPAGCRVAPA